MHREKIYEGITPYDREEIYVISGKHKSTASIVIITDNLMKLILISYDPAPNHQLTTVLYS